MGYAIHFLYQRSTLGDMEPIGKRIRERRKQLGMSRQSDLAEKVGLNQSTVSDIENGAGFGHEYVMAFARALNWSPEELLEGVAGASTPMTEEMRLLMAECANLEKQDIAVLIRTAQGMRYIPKAPPGAPSKQKAA